MPLLAKPQLLDAYRRMRTIREFEERIHVEFATGSIPGFVHLYAGEEASATGICMHLSDADFISSTHRGHGHCIAKGVDPVGMMAEIYGKATGLCKGKGGSMHIADISKGMLGANGIVGAGGPLSCGAALASKIRGNNAVTVCFFGDGASNQGTILESMNLASIWKLPVIFAVENNGYGEGKDDVNIKEWGAILTNYGLTNIDELLNAPRQVKLAAIKRNFRVIEAMAYPSEELQCAAVQENIEALKYITYPCRKARILAKLLT